MHQTSSPGQFPETADVVVVGGGVVTASTAFQLALHGVRRVLLLERRHLAAGATGKSGALVRAHYTNGPEKQLTLERLKVFHRWDEHVGVGNPGFKKLGFLPVVHPDDESNLRENVAVQQQLGGETKIVTAEELSAIEPLMNTADLTVAAFEPTRAMPTRAPPSMALREPLSQQVSRFWRSRTSRQSFVPVVELGGWRPATARYRRTRS